jgi:acetyl esterase/lipase
MIAAVLAVAAIAGSVGLRHEHLRALALPYWLLSWTGQTFALPLALAAWVLVAWTLAQGSTPWYTTCVVLVATAMLANLHLRNRRMASALLAVAASCDAAGGAQPEPLPLLAGLWPLAFRCRDVEVLRDIAYGPHGLRNQLDVYRPRRRNAGALPVLIQVHGGAWVTGNNRLQALPLMHHMAARGWLCVAVNYRLGPSSRFPEMLCDVLRAIAWVRSHATEYGGDARFIALTGGSAGGHLSALAALLSNRPELQPGFEQADTRVDAVVPLYGRYDFLDRHGRWGAVAEDVTRFKTRFVMPASPQCDPAIWNLASPIANVAAQSPPFLAIHGTHDCLIAVQECRDFLQVLRRQAGRHRYVELGGAQHAFDLLHSPVTFGLVRAVEAFLRGQRATTCSSSDPANDATRIDATVAGART